MLFEYWKPTNADLQGEPGKCDCGRSSLLFPVFRNVRDGDELIEYACETCIASGKFIFDAEEIEDVRRFMSFAGIQGRQRLAHFVAIMERHPRPQWGNVHCEWPFHCDDLTEYLGEWNPRDFLRDKPKAENELDWFQQVLVRGDPENAALLDVRTPLRRLLFWRAPRDLQTENWCAPGISVLHAFRCRSCASLLGTYSYD
jgi:hypothetical protein